MNQEKQKANILAIKYPELAKQWHPTKNGDLKPAGVTTHSGKKVWWQCEKGHEWQGIINNRSKGIGCPYCSNQKVLHGYNDLATKNPQLTKEWHPTKNSNLKPTEVTTHSTKKVWWQCEHGHEWEAKIYSRSNGAGCPYCSNKKVLVGFNDLATVNPKLAKEWNFNKNGNLKPTEVAFGSHKKVWWQCNKGHEWQTTINARSSKGTGCPYCSCSGTSLPEVITLYYFKKYSDIEIKHRYKDFGFEIDVYFEFNNQKIGIEYDGAYSHKGKEAEDLNKNKRCIKNNIKLYRIRELPLTKLNDTSIDFTCNHRKKQELLDIISHLIKEIFNKSTDIDINKDLSEINTLVDTLEKENSLTTINPELSKEWHPTKNGVLKPIHVTCNSRKKIWWQCKKGHEWKAVIGNRTNGTGCPYCSNKKVLAGFNDLATTHPKLVEEWNFNKNGDLKPTEVTAHSGKKVWWKCKKGHEWQEMVYNRSKGNGCPYCSGHRVLPGYNDLSATHPQLASEWHPIKNGNLKPANVTPHSNKKVWWKCEKGHEWQASIYARSRGIGCPYCSNRKILVNFNDLATTHPKLAKEWHPIKNDDLKPTNVTFGSSKKVWWQCEKGHEWQEIINNRSKGNGCPYCSGHRVLPGFNDLATAHPELAKQWHPTKNGDLKPIDVTTHTCKKIWWQCDEGHEWQSAVCNRSNGTGCPHCYREKRQNKSQHPKIKISTSNKIYIT